MNSEHRPPATVVAPPANAPRYRAFLSYAHADVTLAKWLHRRLEGYRIDADLVGLETPAGPVPQSLRPIFRDNEDFNGGQSLGEATIAALDASAALLVVCPQVSGSLSSMAQPLRAGTADRRS